MSNADKAVQVTLSLPKDIFERVAQAAVDEQQKIEDLLSVLVTEGLDAHATVRGLFDQVSEQYRTRLGREGKLNQSSDAVLQELRTLRDQIAHELYP